MVADMVADKEVHKVADMVAGRLADIQLSHIQPKDIQPRDIQPRDIQPSLTSSRVRHPAKGHPAKSDVQPSFVFDFVHPKFCI